MIRKLSEKGIHESALKKKMSSILHKRMGYRYNRYNNEQNNSVDLTNPIKIEDIFKNNVLKYENIKNPLRYQKNTKINTITTKTNQFEVIYDKLCNMLLIFFFNALSCIPFSLNLSIISLIFSSFSITCHSYRPVD